MLVVLVAHSSVVYTVIKSHSVFYLPVSVLRANYTDVTLIIIFFVTLSLFANQMGGISKLISLLDSLPYLLDFAAIFHTFVFI